ncbi:insulinase family protein, partial [Thiolapillus sp.]
VLLEWKPELIGELLGYLRPDNLTITLVDPEVKTDKIETYYQVPYRVAGVDNDLLARWEKTEADDSLALPEPNPFMPDRVELKPVEQPMAAPVALAREPGDMLWYQQDRDFGLPKAVFNVRLEIPEARSTASRAVSLSLLVDLVKDELNAWAYPAQLAGLSYDLDATVEGLNLLIYGYDEKQPVLLEKVLAALKHPRLAQDRFQLYKAKMQRSLANQALERPYQQILGERTRRLLKPSWSPEQKLAALEPLTREQLRQYASDLFDEVEARVLAYGNLTAEDARTMDRVLKKQLLSGSRLEEVPEPRLTIIPRGRTLTYRYDVDHPDSAVVISYQGNEKSIGEQARWRLLGHIMASPFFNELRTEQQLGYVVAAAFSETENMPGMLFLVQSSAVSAAELRKRMEAFVKAWADELQAMSEEEFAAHKAGLVSKLLKKDDMMLIRAMRYMNNMEREHYSFDFNARVAEKVKALDKADLLAFYRENLLEQPRRLVVYSPGTRFPEE